jgi:hypothetical protein
VRGFLSLSHGCVGIGEACRGMDRARLRSVRQGTVGAVDKQPLVFKDRRSKSVNGMAVNGTELKGLACSGKAVTREALLGKPID